MTKEFFEEVMRVPSCSRHEGMMQEFLLEWAKKHGCSAKKDSKGNILMTKGSPGQGQFYPAFINHCDTVHHDQEEMVKRRVFKEIIWEGDKVTAINPLLPKRDSSRYGRSTASWNLGKKDDKKSKKWPGLFDKDSAIDVKLGADGTYYEIKDEKPEEKKPEVKDEEKPEKEEEPVEMGRQTGLGMDDQGGCAIALAVIDSLPFAKAMFVVEEEIGMLGSKAADMHFFDDCAFVFSNDSPDRNRGTHCSSGLPIYSDEFFKEHLQKICAAHGLTEFRSTEPWTDIIQVRNHTMPDGKHIECLNFGNGGYNAHQDTEYAKFSDVLAAEELLKALCTKIPLDKQYTSEIQDEPSRWTYSGGGYSGGVYSGGGYTAWRGSQSRGTSDDDWWAGITGRKPAPPQRRKDFPDRAFDEQGAFTFKFKTREAAAKALESLAKLSRTLKDRFSAEYDNDVMITVEGELLAMRYAYLACFNAENNTKYASWDTFIKVVKGAIDAFEKAVAFEDEDVGKMSHGPKDQCSINIYMDDDQGDDFSKMLLDGDLRHVNVDIDTDNLGSFTVSGALDEVKEAYAGAVACMQDTEPRKFKDLDREDQEAFWEDVEFPEDDSDASSSGAEDSGRSDADDFWSWWDQNH